MKSQHVNMKKYSSGGNGSMKICWLLAVLIVTLTTPSMSFADGRVEHHQIISKILADSGEVAERELTVYLPEDYDTSGVVYNVLYLISGTTGTNRTLLGEGYVKYGAAMSYVNAQVIVDNLITDGKMKPLIVVLPHLNRDGASVASLDDYLAQEIVPFVDSTYRTIAQRDARAISGHSRGGHDALHIAFKYPQVFSVVGGHGSGAMGGGVLPAREVVAAHDQTQFPLQFWLSVGKNDKPDRVQLNRDFVGVLQESKFSYVFVEDDGDHFSRVGARLAESLVFFSEQLGGGSVSAQSAEN